MNINLHTQSIAQDQGVQNPFKSANPAMQLVKDIRAEVLDESILYQTAIASANDEQTRINQLQEFSLSLRRQADKINQYIARSQANANFTPGNLLSIHTFSNGIEVSERTFSNGIEISESKRDHNDIAPSPLLPINPSSSLASPPGGLSLENFHRLCVSEPAPELIDEKEEEELIDLDFSIPQADVPLKERAVSPIFDLNFSQDVNQPTQPGQPYVSQASSFSPPGGLALAQKNKKSHSKRKKKQADVLIQSQTVSSLSKKALDIIKSESKEDKEDVELAGMMPQSNSASLSVKQVAIVPPETKPDKMQQACAVIAKCADVLVASEVARKFFLDIGFFPSDEAVLFLKCCKDHLSFERNKIESLIENFLGRYSIYQNKIVKYNYSSPQHQTKLGDKTFKYNIDKCELIFNDVSIETGGGLDKEGSSGNAVVRSFERINAALSVLLPDDKKRLSVEINLAKLKLNKPEKAS